MYNKQKEKIIYLLPILFFLILGNTTHICNSASTIYAFTDDWGLNKYNTIISFASTLYCTSFGYDNYTSNSWWYWYNIYLSGPTLSVLGLSVQNANITVNSLSSKQIILTVNAPSGTTSTTQVYVGNLGRPTSITGAYSWSYDASTKMITITAKHKSPIKLTIFFAEVSKGLTSGAQVLSTTIILFVIVTIPVIAKKILDGAEDIGDVLKGITALALCVVFIVIIANMIEGWGF